MSASKSPEGLRDSVFKAIISDRFSMATPEPVNLPPRPRNLPRCGSTSISFRDFEDQEGLGRKVRSNPMLSVKCSSLESVRSTIPIVTVEPSTPVSPAVSKCPSMRDLAAADVDKKLMIEWLRGCRKGKVEECERLLKKTPGLANYVPPHFLNQAAIHIASVGRHNELIHLLVKHGADLNAQTQNGYTALHLCAQKDDKDTLRLLVALGADESCRDLLGYTYHHYAPWFNKDDDLLEVEVRLRGKKEVRSRPLSQVSAESSYSTESGGGLLRQGSFRSALKKLVIVPSFSSGRSSPSLN